ncbi:MAG TPA: VOC family protein, partial [Steroidobacteraceae bacterium]|nr:VOC family protein [Steroidobacteraceae bacterium]
QDAYLELITVENPDPVDRTSVDVIAPCVAAGGGVPMLALATHDATASHAWLAAAGHDVDAPLTWNRPADTPDGPRTAEFTTLFSRDELLPGFVAFFCQHHTPEFVLHPDWQRHENGAQRLVGIERSTSRDLGAIERQLREFLSENAVTPEPDDRLRVRLGSHVLSYRRNPTDPTVRICIGMESIAALEARNSGRVQRIDAHSVEIALASAGHVSLRFTDLKTDQS